MQHPTTFLVNPIKNVLKEAKQTIKEFASPSSVDVMLNWQVVPKLTSGDRVCLFVTVLRDGAIAPHALYQAQAWAKAGFKTILIAATDDVTHPLDTSLLAFAEGILRRYNRGYDFGAWSAAIQALPELRDAALMVTANDSVLGPLDNFPTMLRRAEASEADFIALTDSFYHRYHAQTYTLFYKPNALRSAAFWRFWRRVRTGDRWMVILRYETRLLKVLKRAGLQTEILFPNPDGGPPATLKGWRALIDRGFPFVKIQLLRDNPFDDNIIGWEDHLRQHGYDPALTSPIFSGNNA